MAQLGNPAARKEIKLILHGITGHGKSATGNSILGREEFIVRSGSKSTTKEVKNAYAEIEQCDVNVVDGPGLEDTDLKQVEQPEIYCSNMAKALVMCNGGVHAFLFVINFTTRFTKEVIDAISDLKKIYGDDCLKKHGIVVITEGDKFKRNMEDEETPDKTFEQWWKEQKADLFKECSPRVVLFNNCSKDEHEKEKQRNELLKHVLKLADEKGLYTNEDFKKFEEIRAKMIKEKKLPIFSEDMQRKINILSGTLLDFPKNPNLDDVGSLNKKIDVLEKEIQKCGCHIKPLKKLSELTLDLRKRTEELVNAIDKKEDPEKLVSALQEERDGLEAEREFSWIEFTGSILGLISVAILKSAGNHAGLNLPNVLKNVVTQLLEKAI